MIRTAKLSGLPADARIDRTGGDYGAGIIRGFSVATVGPALGHGFDLDHVTLAQIAELGNATADRGMKSRFTHPNECNDGMGATIGRAKNFSVVGDQAIADLHFLASSAHSPRGNLAGYVMDLAAESPESFGSSIVALEFKTERRPGDDGTLLIDGKPAPLVMRVAKLGAVDFVDTPAANSGGLFSALPDWPARNASTLLDSIFVGLSAGEIRQRVDEFLSRYLSAKETMPDPAVKPPEVVPPVVPPEEKKPEEKPPEAPPAVVPPVVPPATEPTPAELTANAVAAALKAERLRVGEIVAICKLSGCPERAEAYLSGELSIADVKTSLAAYLAAKNPLPPEDKTAADEPAAKIAKLSAEFKARPNPLGLSEAEWLAWHGQN